MEGELITHPAVPLVFVEVGNELDGPVAHHSCRVSTHVLARHVPARKKKKRNVGFVQESVSSVLVSESKEAEDARIPLRLQQGLENVSGTGAQRYPGLVILLVLVETPERDVSISGFALVRVLWGVSCLVSCTTYICSSSSMTFRRASIRSNPCERVGKAISPKGKLSLNSIERAVPGSEGRAG